MGSLQALVGPEGNFPVPDSIPHPRIGDGDPLIAQVNRASLPAPTHYAREAPFAGIALSGQGEDLVLQGLGYGEKAQGNEGSDEGQLGVQVLGCGKGGEDNRFHLAFFRDSEYSLHGAAPFSVGWWVYLRNTLHHKGVASSIFN
jgi:hypothetical protein